MKVGGRADRTAGLGILLLAAAVAWETRRFVVGFPADPVGPRALPLFAAAILALGTVHLLRRPEEEPTWPEARTGIQLLGATTLLFVYPVLLPLLGFVVTTGGVLAGLSLLFRGPRLRGALAAFLLSGGLYLLFVHALGIPLPVGRLFLAPGS